MSETCPDDYCGLTFNTKEELKAHLRWDHNYNKTEAEVIINEQ